MKEIVERLQENRQIERAKSILESNGYKVTKKSKRLKESSSAPRVYGDVQSISEYLDDFNRIISPESIEEYFGDDLEYQEEIKDFVKEISKIIKENPNMTHVYVDANEWERIDTELIYQDGNCKIIKGTYYLTEEDESAGVKTPGYEWSTDWKFGTWDLLV